LHREKLIEVRTTTIANKDLETYYKALDEALMRFHGIKMKEINNVLKEYWRHTYRGKDIDEVKPLFFPFSLFTLSIIFVRFTFYLNMSRLRRVGAATTIAS